MGRESQQGAAVTRACVCKGSRACVHRKPPPAEVAGSGCWAGWGLGTRVHIQQSAAAPLKSHGQGCVGAAKKWLEVELLVHEQKANSKGGEGWVGQRAVGAYRRGACRCCCSCIRLRGLSTSKGQANVKRWEGKASKGLQSRVLVCAKDRVRACIENLRQQKLLARGAGQGGAWGPGCTYSRVLRHP